MFDAVLHGHAVVEQQLAERLQAGKLPHALLFTGPKGIGKASMARRLVATLLTKPPAEGASHTGLFGDALPVSPPDRLQPDPTHQGLNLLNQGAHPDFLCLERALDEKKGTPRPDITVDQARGVKTFLQKTPAMGRYKVVLVDSIDDLNANAANALLKILEEPATGKLLILISHNPGHLLPTIRSRCQLLPFAALPEEDFQHALHAMEAESIAALSSEQQHFLYTLAAGCPGKAIEYSDAEVLSFLHELHTTLKQLPTASLSALQKVGQTLDAKKEWQATLIPAAQHVILQWLQQTTKQASLAGNSLLAQSLLSEHQRIQQQLQQLSQLKLDPKQVFLHTLQGLQTSLQTAA